MGLFNKYFGDDKQGGIKELSVQQVLKLIDELSPIIDDSLSMRYESGYDEFLSEDDINRDKLKRLRVNLLVQMIFGCVHNDLLNIRENLVNMPSYKETLYAKSYWALCRHWAKSWRVAEEIVKTTDIEYDERTILIIGLYANDFVHKLDFYLRTGIQEYNDGNREVEDDSVFKKLHFLFYNPDEKYPPLEFDYDDNYDLKSVMYFAESVMVVYKKMRKFMTYGG